MDMDLSSETLTEATSDPQPESPHIIVMPSYAHLWTNTPSEMSPINVIQ